MGGRASGSGVTSPGVSPGRISQLLCQDACAGRRPSCSRSSGSQASRQRFSALAAPRTARETRRELASVVSIEKRTAGAIDSIERAVEFRLHGIEESSRATDRSGPQASADAIRIGSEPAKSRARDGLPRRAPSQPFCSARLRTISTLAVDLGAARTKACIWPEQPQRGAHRAGRSSWCSPSEKHQPAEPVAVPHGAPSGSARPSPRRGTPFELDARRETASVAAVEPDEYGQIAAPRGILRVRLDGARGHAPVDRAQVVTGLIGTRLVELDARPLYGAQIPPGHHDAHARRGS